MTAGSNDEAVPGLQERVRAYVTRGRNVLYGFTLAASIALLALTPHASSPVPMIAGIFGSAVGVAGLVVSWVTMDAGGIAGRGGKKEIGKDGTRKPESRPVMRLYWENIDEKFRRAYDRAPTEDELSAIFDVCLEALYDSESLWESFHEVIEYEMAEYMDQKEEEGTEAAN